MRIRLSDELWALPKEAFQLIQDTESIKDTAFETKPLGFWADVGKRFVRNKASFTAFIMICIIVIMAIFGPGLTPQKYDEQNLERENMPVRIPILEKFGIADGSRVIYNRRVDNLTNTEKYPEGSIISLSNERLVSGVKVYDVKVNYYTYKGADDEYYIFGTDYLGRDLWTRLWRGSRVSLFIAVIAVFANVVIGIVYGAVAGYYGGKLDLVMMRIAEIINAFPRIVVITLFIMYFGTGIFSIAMALIIKGWIPTAIMIRSQFYRFKKQEYVLAARTLGVKDIILIFRHILPNSIGPIITWSMIAIPGAIFSESFLAYIGLGLQAPEPSIGVLLSHGQKVLLHFPYQALFPGLLISVLMISFNLFANGLRDAFDPTLRGAG